VRVLLTCLFCESPDPLDRGGGLEDATGQTRNSRPWVTCTSMVELTSRVRPGSSSLSWLQQNRAVIKARERVGTIQT